LDGDPDQRLAFIKKGTCDLTVDGACGFEAWQLRAADEAIAPTLKLYSVAKDKGVTVFFITGRCDAGHMREATKANLKSAGYGVVDDANLIMRSKESCETKLDSVVAFKAPARGEIEKQGYKIIANVGDQWSRPEWRVLGAEFQGTKPVLFHKVAYRLQGSPCMNPIGGPPTTHRLPLVVVFLFSRCRSRGRHGPCVDRYAFVVELKVNGSLEPAKEHPITHFLDLEALAVRDLAHLNKGEILVLGGPVGEASGPFGLFRWQPSKSPCPCALPTIGRSIPPMRNRKAFHCSNGTDETASSCSTTAPTRASASTAARIRPIGFPSPRGTLKRNLPWGTTAGSCMSLCGGKCRRAISHASARCRSHG
jgi:HAD superfamily, subfamily IIIB (Acid phosphatase)/Protein of unknown function (DUF3616)